MHPLLKIAFANEMQQARELNRRNELREAFAHLERAHALGQRHGWPRTVNHYWMLKVGLRLRDRREAWSQLQRFGFGAAMAAFLGGIGLLFLLFAVVRKKLGMELW